MPRLGGKALAVHTDVASTSDVAELARRATEAFGRIDVWINNAMVTVVSPVKLGTAEEVKRRGADVAGDDGAVIGSREFVNEAFAAARERFGPKRKDGARVPMWFLDGRTGRTVRRALSLTEAEYASWLVQLPGWEVTEVDGIERLERTYFFDEPSTGLDPHNRDAGAFLRPYPAEWMRVHAVSPRVNRPEHDDAALIESITARSD